MKYALAILLFLTAHLYSVDVILLFGPPGSGKGTFSQYAKTKGYAHISAGDLVRAEIYNKTSIGLEIQELVEKGGYIDPELMFQLLKQKVVAFAEKDIPFIIDGYGRFPEDVQRLRNLLSEVNAKVTVFFLEADDAVCTKRILSRLVCGKCTQVFNEMFGNALGEQCPNCKESALEKRFADNEEATKTRLHTYRTQIDTSYRSFTIDLPTISINTNRSIECCFEEYNILLDNL